MKKGPKKTKKKHDFRCNKQTHTKPNTVLNFCGMISLKRGFNDDVRQSPEQIKTNDGQTKDKMGRPVFVIMKKGDEI
jgi:hypothetical protein